MKFNKQIPPVLFVILLLASHRLSNAQEIAVNTQTDTSYFVAGDHNRNLVESVIKNSAENSTMLLQRGANPDALSSTGNSALMYAVEKGNMEIMKMLVEHGANVNAKGYNDETPLFIAIFKNDFQAAKYLLEQGADANVKDGFGVTPLIYAAATNQYQSADLLMFYNADETVSDDQGNDPLMAAVTFENIETTDVLLQNGLNPDTRDQQDNTPAIVATQHGTHIILELLLEYGANVNLSNKKNYTPLAYAIIYGDVASFKLLMDKGADIHHKTNKGRSMADLARTSGNDTIMALIRDHGGKPAPGTDFSEFQLLFGNSFNSTDYLIQFRGGMVDSKFGYYFETGVDYRPFLLHVQPPSEDTIYQFRERRIGWSHSIGKYFRLAESPGGVTLSAYASVNGYLSFPDYKGTSNDPGIDYKIIPAAGLSLLGKFAGIKTGVDWYNFETTLDKSLKFNLSVYFRIAYPKVQYDRKEIYWE
ncbi:MAG: ankyrin repeat domain-containing protein [Bacteroidales bacterium]